MARLSCRFIAYINTGKSRLALRLTQPVLTPNESRIYHHHVGVGFEGALMQDLYSRLLKRRAEGLLITLLLIVLLLLLWDNLPRPWKSTTNAQTAAQSRIPVWVNRRSGFYYCPDSKLYGKLKPGFFTSQGKALQAGYRPPFNQTCQ
jgi:hypothetical protein